jgi:hypothetical protein
MVPGIVRSCKAVTPTARFTEGLCGCPSLLMLEIRYTLLPWVVLSPRSATGLQLSGSLVPRPLTALFCASGSCGRRGLGG